MWDVGGTRLERMPAYLVSIWFLPQPTSHIRLWNDPPLPITPKLREEPSVHLDAVPEIPEPQVLVRGVLVVVEVGQWQRDDGGAEYFGEEVARTTAASRWNREGRLRRAIGERRE